MKISLLFFSLVTALTVAMVACMPMIPQKAIGRGFYRFNVLLGLILLLPFFFIHPYANFHLPFLTAEKYSTPAAFSALMNWLFILYGAFLMVLLFLFSRQKRDNGIIPFIYGGTIIFGLLVLLLDSFLYLPHHGEIWWEYILIPLNVFSSAALLGSVMFAMLLGHWYLVQFDLDKNLLKRVCAVYCWAVGIRVLVIGLGLLLYWKSASTDPLVFLSLVSMEGHGLFFWMRMVIGLALPLGLSFMIYSTAKIGANQSCTGLLYIAVLFVLMGEMVSRYVFFLKGVPL